MVEAAKLTKQVRHGVFVRFPRRSGLASVLTGMGVTVLADSCRGRSVTGMGAAGSHKPLRCITYRSRN
ncbi:MAG: hypothetical protein M3143_13100 [Actinomycetota bacterium]|nr:hypothetical protein [Actinomycetota bacterium]